jgi:hypothetical protein
LLPRSGSVARRGRELICSGRWQPASAKVTRSRIPWTSFGKKAAKRGP